jgi:LysM repeat protein
MNTTKIQAILIGLIVVLSLIIPGPSLAQGDSTTAVINTINQLRAQRGLAALEPHPALMQIAQQHSQYQASIGTWTHLSADGSRPRDRAIAAGFGNGAYVYLSENVAYGYKSSIMEIINGPWNDPEHHHTMYNPSAKYIGAGVAYSGDNVFYTVDTGHWTGDPAPTSEFSVLSATPEASLMPTAVPVVVSTPMEDGSVIHIIQGGQTLWTIAAVYNIPLDTLREINGFETDVLLQPGDSVMILPSYTPTSTPIGEPSPTLPVKFSHTPSPIAAEGTAIPYDPATKTATEEQIRELQFQRSGKNPTFTILAVLISGGTLLTAIYFSIRKPE